MTNDKLRWGILSTANIGKKAVIPAIKASSNGTVAALASRDGQHAQVVATELGIPQSYGSYEELLADPGIDAVYIPLPNSLHYEWTIKAARAGKHILCEKPLALNADQCMEMAVAAEQAGVLLMEAFMYRFHPQLAQVRALLDQGAIGDVRLLRSAFTFRLTNPANIRLQSELGGGSLMDVGCYCVNLSRTLFDAEPVEVQAFASWSAGGVDEQIVGTLHFANGRYAQFDSALTLARRETYQVVGTDGVLDLPVAFLPGTNDTLIYQNRGGPNEQSYTVAGVDEYRLMVEHFAGAVLGQRPVRYPASEAARNVRVIEALYRSARNNGRPEAVEPV
ncbi:MAG: Gfo/Idh/MocA family oxidoreductase [Herpetosiphonaceae bacterium]|nr:Gfo/Idh/MocA family oxidoreductase [Herpetosiphonaceae bacterium]